MSSVEIANSTEEMNREKFMKRFPGLSTEDHERLDFAYDIAKEAHGYLQQTRDNGERYFNHPREVAVILVDKLGIRDIPTIIIALLHDVVEDTYIWKKPGRITLVFGQDVGVGVHALAKPDKSKFSSKEEFLHFYFDQVVRAGGWRACLAKIADRIHNLSDMESWKPERIQKYHEETREYFGALIEVVHSQYSGVIAARARELLTAHVGPIH